jgi:hypothetical protein
VVLNILKNISQWEGLSHILWTNKKCSKPPTSMGLSENSGPDLPMDYHASCCPWKKLFVGISTIFRQTHEQYPDVMLCAFAKMGMHDINYILTGYEWSHSDSHHIPITSPVYPHFSIREWFITPEINSAAPRVRSPKRPLRRYPGELFRFPMFNPMDGILGCSKSWTWSWKKPENWEGYSCLTNDSLGKSGMMGL